MFNLESLKLSWYIKIIKILYLHFCHGFHPPLLATIALRRSSLANSTRPPLTASNYLDGYCHRHSQMTTAHHRRSPSTVGNHRLPPMTTSIISTNCHSGTTTTATPTNPFLIGQSQCFNISFIVIWHQYKHFKCRENKKHWCMKTVLRKCNQIYEYFYFKRFLQKKNIF